jgi:hypothetical protein
MIRTMLIGILGLSAGIARDGLAQHQTLAPESRQLGAESALSLSGMVGGKPIQVSGGGTCSHAPDTSMGGTSASLWTVEYRGSDEGTVKELNLSLLRPKDGGPDQLSFVLKSKSGDHRIETGLGRKQKGEGTVTILPSGPGGRLELSGRDAKGKSIQISIDCPAFKEAGAGGS